MNLFQNARQEWEDKTTQYPKNHTVGKKIYVHEFRRFAQAIAWLEWEGNNMEIKKLEKIPGAGRGSATPLITFLKTLADKYHGRIFGNATIYEPDPPIPEGPLLTQDQLEALYEKHGFKLRKCIKSGIVDLWYPDAPKVTSDLC